MGKLNQKIVSGLQWRKKWVRIMLVTSVFAILVLVFIPDFNQSKPIVLPVEEMIMADSIFTVERPAGEIQPKTISRPVPRQVESIIKEQPKEPFDWKGTITWAIGAMNGLILIVLNIKNLIFKKK